MKPTLILLAALLLAPLAALNVSADAATPASRFKQNIWMAAAVAPLGTLGWITAEKG